MKTELNNDEPQKFSKVTHCWEFKKCEQILCPVYLNEMGTICYYIAGTLGEGAGQSINSKIEGCRKCDFYQYSEKHSLEFREEMLKHLKKLEDELQSLLKVSPEEKAAIFKRRAEYLSKRISYKEPEEKVKIVTFCLGSEKYCIRTHYALEIINATDINKLPCAPRHFVGVINLRGNILTIVDLKEVLDIERNSENSSEIIVVIEVDGETAGILVDKVEDILDIGAKQIAPPLTTLRGKQEEFTEGEILIEGQPFTLLDLEKMMRDKTMKIFEVVNPNL
ncbi:MAG: hypothetical protein AMJ42_02895 [Deltaproteobacteria bacterium DG_8]|nr:MAG: hypothetical protein AMJ42_02895 [Deltaproteobacteria bacterium DG_8]